MRNNSVNNSSNRTKILIAVGIIILVIIIRITSNNTLGLAPIESFMKQMLYPVQEVSNNSSTGVVYFLKGLVDYKNVKEENDRLKEEVGRLETFNSELLQYKVENDELKKLLQIQQQNTDLVMVNAEVIGRSIKDWYKTITVNKGQSSGIQVNMPVVNSSGFIGKVTNVTKSTAEITLLTDPKYGAITVVTTETGYPGILLGDETNQGTLQMIQIPANANIMEGYEVVTSGLGDLTFKNLRIGKIKSITNSSDGLMKKAIVEPYANFNNINFVSIIIKQEIKPATQIPVETTDPQNAETQ